MSTPEFSLQEIRKATLQLLNAQNAWARQSLTLQGIQVGHPLDVKLAAARSEFLTHVNPNAVLAMLKIIDAQETALLDAWRAGLEEAAVSCRAEAEQHKGLAVADDVKSQISRFVAERFTHHAEALEEKAKRTEVLN